MSTAIKNLHLSTAQKYVDKHTCYIDCGAIPKDKLEKIISDGIVEVVKKLKLQGQNINPEHRVNLVCNKDNNSLGYAYAWFFDEKLYNICNKLNPNGTKRIETILDPNWKPKASTPVPEERPYTPVIPEGTNWAELSDEEEENVQPTIERKLEPLIRFAPYTYNAQEKLEVQRIIKYSLNKKALNLFMENIAHEEGKNPDDTWKFYDGFQKNTINQGYSDLEFFDAVIKILNNTDNYGITLDDFMTLFNDVIDSEEEADVKIDSNIYDSCTIDVSGAYVLNVAEDEQKNVLQARIMCKLLPSAEQIRARFMDYMENKNSKYPQVIITQPSNKQGGSVKVIFDDKTRIAQFVLYMCRKVEFSNPKCLLLFNIAKGSKRQN